MKLIIKTILESVSQIKSFEKEYDVELPDSISESQLNDLKEAFSYLPKKFIKHHIKKIIFKDLGAIHGRYIGEYGKGNIILNPTIFKNKRYFKIDDEEIPVKYFTIIHEIGHMVDHLTEISDTTEWIELSGWKKLDIAKKVPSNYKRYIEKRSGRNIPGHKKSEWIHKNDAEFVRNYASKNPKEDFADTFAFFVLGKEFDFKSGGKEKIDIIRNFLKNQK